jgi:hypothetical protein
MRFISKCKDGGPESPVDAYTLVEIKGLFSIILLKFNEGRREAFHSHAFNAYTWFISGDLKEERLFLESNTRAFSQYHRSLLPKYTSRDNLHRVSATKDSWCFTIRGPWVKRWEEYEDATKCTTVLGYKRTVIKKTYQKENYE